MGGDGKDTLLQGFINGFCPDAPPVGKGLIPDSLRAGSQNVWLQADGLLESVRGLGPAGIVGDSLLYLVGSDIGSITSGSVVLYQQASDWYIGSGSVRINGVVIGTASTHLQFLLNGSTYMAGLAAPTTKVLILESATSSTKNEGSYAVQITRKRSATQAESNPSPPSDAITVAGKKVTVTFPAALTGQDTWVVYATTAGLGKEGPFLFLTEVIVGMGGVAAGGGTMDFEWYNSDLGSSLPPTDHNPPYEGLFCSPLQDVMLNFGILNGVGIGCSAIGDPESYPNKYILLTTPPEIPVGFASRSNADNELLFWTANALMSIVYTGDSASPVFIRSRWPMAGIKSKTGGCFAENDFYCDSNGTPTQIRGGQADTTFAQRVQRFIRKLGANHGASVVGYDQRYQAVVYCYGNMALPYMRQYDKWNPPIIMSGSPTAAVTKEGKLELSVGGNLVDWEGGVGSAWKARTAYIDLGSPVTHKTFLGVQAVVNTDVEQLTVKVFKNGDETTAIQTQNSTGAGFRNTDFTEGDEAAKYWQVELSGTSLASKDHAIFGVESIFFFEEGVESNVRG